jgi:hypothetical protein
MVVAKFGLTFFYEWPPTMDLIPAINKEANIIISLNICKSRNNMSKKDLAPIVKVQGKTLSLI